MASIYTQSIESILDNYADAIEGGNSYRGSGTAYNGIAGYESPDEFMGDTVTSTEGEGASTTTVISTTIADEYASRFVRASTAPVFFQCLTQASGTLNVGQARKVTAYAASTDTYTVAPAFSESTAIGDTFKVLEGFKRAPDTFDLMNASGDVDRYFDLRLIPGARMDMTGADSKYYMGQLVIRLRLVIVGRARLAEERALVNLQRFRSVLDRGDLRDGTYTQAVMATNSEPEIEEEDERKIIVSDRYDIIYKLNATYS